MAGIAAIVWGLTLISPIVGFVAGGLALILVGLFIDPPARKGGGTNQLSQQNSDE